MRVQGDAEQPIELWSYIPTQGIAGFVLGGAAVVAWFWWRRSRGKANDRDEQSSLQANFGKEVVYGLGFAALIVGLWLWWDSFSMTRNRPGVRGDAFGALNALFSGLAFVALIVTLRLQKKDLQLQLEEIQKSVSAQQQIASQAKFDSKADQAMRILELYSAWRQAVGGVRLIFAPADDGEEESSTLRLDSSALNELVAARSRLLDAHFALSMVDPAFDKYTIEWFYGGEESHPTTAWVSIVDQVLSEFDGVGFWRLSQSSAPSLADDLMDRTNDLLDEVKKRLHAQLPRVD